MNIKAVMNYMRTNIEENYKIEEISSFFGYSKYEFSKKFKNRTGFSASRFLSFLKIEKALRMMIVDNENILNCQLRTGYRSSGTFTNIFSRYTGMSPSNYKKNIKKFYEVLLNYIDSVKEEDTLYDTYFEDNEKMTSPQETGNLFTVNLIFPENYISEVAFIGLFRGPFPDKNPVLGKAVIPYKTGNKCIFNNIPDGKYYLMACSVEKGSGYLNFFDLRDSLRSRLKNPLIFPSDEKIESSLLFRKPETTDFPIILNLPNFVFRIMERRINNSLTEISQIRQ